MLQERGTRLTAAASDPAGTSATTGPDDTGPDDTGPEGNGSGPGGSGPAGGPGGPGGSGPGRGPAGGPDGPGHGGPPGADAGPSLAALVTITVPWSALTGQSATPAEVGGYGIIDAADARDLAAAAARDPRTRWCVTALHPDGTAAAHGCAPGRHPPPPGTRPQDWITRLRITMTPITRGTCDHPHAEAGYRPSRKLRHLVRARNARCTAPGCGRPAPAATWTTPPPGNTADSPANATSRRCAATIIGANKPKDGTSNSPNQAF